jgi:hypothetical protein
MHHRASVVFLFATVLAAQTPPCTSLNDATTSVSSVFTAIGGAGRAYQISVSTSLVLYAAEIFTESTSPGYQSLAIYDYSGSAPDDRLGGGAWQNQPNLGLAWQGTSFDVPVALHPGWLYWLVWGESGGNRLPYEPGGVTTPHALPSGPFPGWAIQANPEAIKWRGYCSYLGDANVTPIGLPCQDGTFLWPPAFTNNAPQLGNADFQIEATSFFGGSIGLILLGVNPSWVGVPVPGTFGCVLHVDPLVTHIVQPVGGGNGNIAFDLPIPADPLLLGITIDSQFAVYYSGLVSTLPMPFVFTNGLRITLF